MAGDWIKLEHATLDKPEVLRAADLLGIHRREALGLFIEFWIWLDKNLSASCPDFVRNMSRKSLDDVLHVQGFASVLQTIGWAKFDDSTSTMTIINAQRHNGNTAKSRGLDQKRKQRERENGRPVSVRLKTGPEKRREEKNPIVPASPKFELFWKQYPGPRKFGKTKCLALWTTKGFEAVGDQILLHVAAMAQTPQWLEQEGQFVPSPVTYLNQRRFEDGLPEAPRPRLVI